ncbi:MAG: serine/threonine protein kinase [Planctomycetota bacterium]
MTIMMKCACPGCRKVLDAKSEHAGRAVRCPGCQKVFKLPAAKAAVQVPEPPKLESCPLCAGPWSPGAVACGDCGFMPQPVAPPAPQVPQIRCIHPPCGASNDVGRKTCLRCGTLLPCPPGTVLEDRYRVDALLALGGFGAVYRGTDLASGATIAIKEMLCADKAQFTLRLNFFRREAEILKSLASESIVPGLLAFIEQEHAAYLVMDFIEGKDLLKVLEASNNRPFPIEVVADWGVAICQVLDTMHRHDPPLIHRDVKPDNLMLLDNRTGIRMIDFGTARDIGPSGPDGQRAKTRIFTEGYAPPEQVVGRPEIRSDLFALAGTLYHLSTGSVPEGTSTGAEIKARLAGQGVPYPESDRWFWDLIRINLSEDPSDRYFSARDLGKDLAGRSLATQVACDGCGETNAVRIPYCAGCAAELTDAAHACLDCGKPSRMGCRYCIHCGGRMR